MKTRTAKWAVGICITVLSVVCFTGCETGNDGYGYYDYYYYPDWDVYYYPWGGYYYWNDHGHWHHGRHVPEHYHFRPQNPEPLHLHTPRPWTEHRSPPPHSSPPVIHPTVPPPHRESPPPSFHGRRLPDNLNIPNGPPH
ncbi:MAG TPA: hypothetical protein VFV23_09650 [Verrucomicrobiae bacterium]|nr:hypothetical protein [Verrucomicrobiae bacterium]